MTQTNHPRRWTMGIALSTVAALAAGFTVGCAKTSPQNAGGGQQPATADCEVTDTEGSPDKVMSPSGEYTARKGDPVVLKHDDETTEIDTESANDLHVNSSGVVVGSRGPYDMGDSGAPWVYRDGETTDLAVPDEANNVTIMALGDDGTVVARMDTGSSDDSEEANSSRAVIWEPGEEEPTVPDHDAAKSPGDVVGVTEDGDIISNHKGPWRWSVDDKGEALPSVPEAEAPDGFDEEGNSPDELLGKVTDVTGDWVLSKSFGKDFYRWNMSDKGKPEKLELPRVKAIDGKGRAYGYLEGELSQPGVEDEDPAALPLPDGKKFDEIGVDNASLDGEVLTGRASRTYEKIKQVSWTCP